VVCGDVREVLKMQRNLLTLWLGCVIFEASTSQSGRPTVFGFLFVYLAELFGVRKTRSAPLGALIQLGNFILGDDMVSSKCKWCGLDTIRSRPAVFCNRECKAQWQRTQKPVDKDWLYQKYVVEKLSCAQIGKIVYRDPKSVYRWLKDFEIPTRRRGWDVQIGKRFLHPKQGMRRYWNHEWLYAQYIILQKSSAEIAADEKCHPNSILLYLKRFSIPRRSTSEVRKIKHWGCEGKDNPMFGKIEELNGNWKGGITAERQAFYVSQEWKKVSRKVWKRDKGFCQRCGIERRESEDVLHIHHIVSFEDVLLRAELNNLILLCKKCHNFVHSKENVNNDFIKETYQ